MVLKGGVPLSFKKFLDKKIWGLGAAALGVGILAALIFPFWFLVICLAVILVILGICYI